MTSIPLVLSFLALFVRVLAAAPHALLSPAQAVLAANWVPAMNSTLPSPSLYPHQWSWDSAFVTMGYSHYDTPRAIAELHALFRAQWANGLLPHIVFNPATDESYFPGPSFWNTHRSPHAPPAAATSGIVQPPVHAIASLAVYRNAKGPHMNALARRHLTSIYPNLVAWHRYLYEERDPLQEGLVFLRHMWESGMDNSPAWEEPLAAMSVTPDSIPAYSRVDKGKVAHAKERPTSFFYDRAVYLIKIFYDNAYDEKAIFEKSPFLVQDVLFNSILSRAGMALAEIADILHKNEEADAHRQRAEKTAKAITDKLYDPVDKFYYNYNMVTKKLIRRKISGGFGAFYGAKMDDEHVNALIDHLYSRDFLNEDLSAWTIPSVAKTDPSYTNSTYWKGPAWLNINYIVREGLLANAAGNRDAVRIAAYLKERSIEMIEKAGFYEYFNPMSGSPHGGHQFSWSAALIIDWICTTNRAYGERLTTKDQGDPVSLLGGNNAFYASLTAAVASIIIVIMRRSSSTYGKERKDDAEILQVLRAANKKARADATPDNGSMSARRRNTVPKARRSS